MRTPFEPFTPGGCHVPNTNLYRLAPGYGVENLADSIAQRIEFEGPETVSAVILEPVQNAGGCFTPPDGYFQRVREICDEYDVLLISDEVICSWGRLGYYFGAERYGYQPDIITTAKGITSAYAPMGAVSHRRVFEPFATARRRSPRHHVRRAPDPPRSPWPTSRPSRTGHPRTCASTSRPSARCLSRCATSDRRRRAAPATPRLELVADRETKATSPRGASVPRLPEQSVQARADLPADDRGDPDPARRR
jgi:hypothetical protein